MTREKVTLTRPFLTHTGTLTVEKPKPNLPESNMSISIPLAPNAVLTVHDGFLSPLEADALLRHTMDLPLMSNPTFALYGKPATMHRDIGFFTDAPGVEGYRYSGQIARSIPLTPALQEILERVNATKASWTPSVLIRMTSGLSHPTQYSVCPRAVRASFVFVRKKVVCAFTTRLQHTDSCWVWLVPSFTHEVPPGLKAAPDGVRVSLTFRRHVA